MLKDYTNEKVTRDTVIDAQCTMCNKKMISKTFRDLVKSENTGCVDHCKTMQQQKFKATNLEMYQVEHPMYLDEFKQKQKETSQKNWHVDHPSQCDEFKQKKKETNSFLIYKMN